MNELSPQNDQWSIPAPDMQPSALTEPGMKQLEADFGAVSIVKYIRDVEYARPDGKPLYLQLLLPSVLGETEKRPMVVFVRGSAWQKQSVAAGIPQLVELARHGFIVASAEYRPAPDAHFPAQPDDIWAAVRFLCAHAGEMKLDTDRIAVWGSSSGAHTALLMAMLPRYQAEHVKLRAVVDYYGPSYLPAMIGYHESSTAHLDALLGVPVLENSDLAKQASPACYAGQPGIPPVLILHGDKDKSCSFEQSVILYRELRLANADVTMYRMHNAAHGGSPFWTPQVLELVENFLRSRLGAGAEQAGDR